LRNEGFSEYLRRLLGGLGLIVLAYSITVRHGEFQEIEAVILLGFACTVMAIAATLPAPKKTLLARLMEQEVAKP
jgi:hypothetical protein